MSKKENILQSALFLFARHGFTETSIEKIARHAKVSKGLTYTHFKNKDDLLGAVIQHSITQMTAEMMEIKEMKIGSLLSNFFKSLRKNKEVIRLCLLLIIHPETPALVNQLLEQQKQELLQLLSQLLERKHQDNSSHEARILLATLDGICLDYVSNPDPKALKTVEKYLTEKYA